MASLQRFFARDHWTLEMIEERYDRFIREESDGSGLSFSVFRKTDRKLVGDCGFRDIGKSGKTAEFGIILHRSVWGKAFATETRLLCYEYAFTELGLDAIRMMTDQDNLRNLGFLKKFQIRQVAEDKSGYRHFEVTKAEWPDIRSAFESELRRK
jgi:RimJ/RimL family protein N-acetyltransferase